MATIGEVGNAAQSLLQGVFLARLERELGYSIWNAEGRHGMWDCHCQLERVKTQGDYYLFVRLLAGTLTSWEFWANIWINLLIHNANRQWKVSAIENEGHVLGVLYPAFSHVYISFALFLVYHEGRKLLYNAISLSWCSDKAHGTDHGLSLKSESLSPSNHFLMKVVLASVWVTMT